MQTTLSSDAQASQGDAAGRVYLRTEVYKRLAAAKGARSVAAQARLHGIHRATLFSLLAAKTSPTLVTAMKMAADLDTTVDELWARTETQAA